MLNNIFDSIEKQKRVVQWGIYALVFMVGFMIWSEGLDPLRQSWADQANEIESNIAEVRSAGDLARQFRAHEDTIVSIGEVDIPRSRSQATERINGTVSDILDSHRSQIREDSFELTSGRFLDKRDTVGLLGGDRRALKLSGKLEFEANRTVVSDIISALEADPDIEGVRSVRLTHQGRDNVRAIIEFEAWVLA